MIMFGPFDWAEAGPAIVSATISVAAWTDRVFVIDIVTFPPSSRPVHSPARSDSMR
jgi:hypothetical protein